MPERSEQINPAEQGERNNPEIERVSLEDALSRAVWDESDGGSNALEEKPGYYTTYQGFPPSYKSKAGHIVREELLKKEYAWLGIDIDDYFNIFKECITNPDKIYELAENLHPSTTELYCKMVYPEVDNIKDIPKNKLIKMMLGMEDGLNPNIRFFSSSEDDEAIKEAVVRDVLRGFEQDLKPKLGRPNFVNKDLDLKMSADEEGVDYGDGVGQMQIWSFSGFLGKDGKENDEKNLATMVEIERIVNELKKNQMISDIYLKPGGIPVPYWEREK